MHDASLTECWGALTTTQEHPKCFATNGTWLLSREEKTGSYTAQRGYSVSWSGETLEACLEWAARFPLDGSHPIHTATGWWITTIPEEEGN